ncbi:MAG: hypothetical protein P4L55_09470 [Syntrophobacteraceae bacterium]|nr:hypothetical protein [Syntrophobacteraceae bacterium]
MKKKELCCSCAALVLWGLGAVLLLGLWNYQKSLSDPLGAYIQFSLMFLATFYVLAFFPIKECLDRLSRHLEASKEVPEHPST